MPTLTQKVEYGYEVLQTKWKEISEGQRPALDTTHPAPWLPVKTLVKRHTEYTVLEAGDIVAWQGNYLVAANGGTARVITYTSSDVGEVLDVENFDDTVAGTAANAKNSYVAAADVGVPRASTKYPANKPVGWMPMNVYNYAKAYGKSVSKLLNYNLQDSIPILCRWLVEFPLTITAQDSITAGDLLIPNSEGKPVPIGSGAADKSDIEQIVGRVTRLYTISEWIRASLDKVRVVPGSGVSGDETGGRPRHLYVNHETTGSLATLAVRVNLVLL